MKTAMINKKIKLVAMFICFALIFVLVFSEKLTADHDCVGELCTVCALCARVKGVLALLICTVFCISARVSLPHARIACAVRETLVSRKAKLTI